MMTTYQELPQVTRLLCLHNAWGVAWGEYLDGIRTLESLDQPEKAVINALDEMYAVVGISKLQRIMGV